MGGARILLSALLLMLVVGVCLVAGCARTYVDENDELRETCHMLENSIRSTQFCSLECSTAWDAADERCFEELSALGDHPEAEDQARCLARCPKVAECGREIGGESAAIDCGCMLDCLAARSASYRRLATASSLCWYDEGLRDACF